MNISFISMKELPVPKPNVGTIQWFASSVGNQ